MESLSLDISCRRSWLATRHVLMLLGCLGFVNVYAMRVNLSVAIVAMVNDTAIPHVNISAADVCPVPLPSKDTVKSPQEGEFIWDETLQGVILSSFFWGYTITQIPGGRMAEVMGGKRLFGIGVLITSLLTLLTPVAAQTHPYLLIAVRVLEGLGEGVTFPAMHAMLARWAPPLERTKMTSFVYAGTQFGTVISLPVSGLLSDCLGWPSVFYVFGVLGVVWFVIWMLLISDTPAQHPRISLEEKIYIQTKLEQETTSQGCLPIPWKALLTSGPFWAILVTHVSQNWGFYTLLTELPTYMKNILHFDMKQNSLLSAVPYLAMWIFILLTSWLADYLREHHISTAAARKIFNTSGLCAPAVSLMVLGFIGCDRTAAVSLVTIAVGLNGAVFSGYMSNHIDIASNFAGTLLGLTNTAATIPGILGPYVVGTLVNGKESLGQWRIVFFIASGIYLGGSIVFVLMASGEEQPWNKLQEEDETEEDVHNKVPPSDI